MHTDIEIAVFESTSPPATGMDRVPDLSMPTMLRVPYSQGSGGQFQGQSECTSSDDICSIGGGFKWLQMLVQPSSSDPPQHDRSISAGKEKLLAKDEQTIVE